MTFVSEEVEVLFEGDPNYAAFQEVFSKFAKAEELTTEARRLVCVCVCVCLGYV